MREGVQRTTIAEALHKAGLYGRVLRRDKKGLRDCQKAYWRLSMWGKVVWSDDTELCLRTIPEITIPQ